ncbi:hypothetical protein OG435_48205 [Streptomyces sp. NBC_01264]|nr:hypothetical protein [Streptomyces sp. NBC_01264]MCX4784353.1 hypothetical protein [Streptomyces sp. NBC_01264]
MVAEVRSDYPNESAAIKAVAEMLGIGSTETLRKWVRQDQIDSGARSGVTSEESAGDEERDRRAEAGERHPEGRGEFLRGRTRPATSSLVAFIDEHRDRFGGVEPVCGTLTEHDCKIAPSTYYAHRKRLAEPSARTVRDEELKPLIHQGFKDNSPPSGSCVSWTSAASSAARR